VLKAKLAGSQWEEQLRAKARGQSSWPGPTRARPARRVRPLTETWVCRWLTTHTSSSLSCCWKADQAAAEPAPTLQGVVSTVEPEALSESLAVHPPTWPGNPLQTDPSPSSPVLRSPAFSNLTESVPSDVRKEIEGMLQQFVEKNVE